AYCLLRGYGFRARGLRPRPGMTEENMLSIVCISPVDGREVVRRAAASAAEIEAALAAARSAQAEWKRLPLAERGRILSKAVDAMLAMRAEIAPELAWQMGRPIRAGGNELNCFEERARA